MELLVDANKIDPGSICYQAPSNIALVKYWGKHGDQLPRNPNASLTLTVARTITELSYTPRASSSSHHVEVRLFYDGIERESFAKRISGYFTRLLHIYPFLGQFDWTINTHNTFPHGAGIASSASAMAAIAVCLVNLEEKWFGALDSAERKRKASLIARLGSGSAGRSVFAKAAAWGKSHHLDGSSDEYAVPLADMLHTSFSDYQDSILLVSKKEKSVSSTAGHALMENHPYAAERYHLANRRFGRLMEVLRKGELDDFCQLVEADALDLHALMMQSYPPYILLEPATINVIKEVQQFRKDSGLPVCFTLDAGPNVHLLYPKSITKEVTDWMKAVVMPMLPQGRIDDHVGEGPSTAVLPKGLLNTLS